MAAAALILNTIDILFLFVIKALVTVTKTPLNLSGLSGRSGCHVEQKVPRVEQKFHLSHFVETKYLVTTNRGGHGMQKWQPIRIPEESFGNLFQTKISSSNTRPLFVLNAAALNEAFKTPTRAQKPFDHRAHAVLTATSPLQNKVRDAMTLLDGDKQAVHHSYERSSSKSDKRCPPRFQLTQDGRSYAGHIRRSFACEHGRSSYAPARRH